MEPPSEVTRYNYGYKLEHTRRDYHHQRGVSRDQLAATYWEARADRARLQRRCYSFDATEAPSEVAPWAVRKRSISSTARSGDESSADAFDMLEREAYQQLQRMDMEAAPTPSLHRLDLEKPRGRQVGVQRARLFFVTTKPPSEVASVSSEEHNFIANITERLRTWTRGNVIRDNTIDPARTEERRRTWLERSVATVPGKHRLQHNEFEGAVPVRHPQATAQGSAGLANLDGEQLPRLR
ncbi:uncharacterized protein BDZ99DRAFT_539161 [Mytilinidion resinicola]|uniref:Uncharacterized protein n=1 Tax=Mytilinidion resinicola TaxID=574789 RepID=A0A6A6YAR9_9PEZI|nr:uncharacterized protein BDZ99DRAFT_539161 [Mytilinidion resinicola]KAF2805912.1 hypothetical protein BDZ99DRAFT_539161 [Mytilinidion resinicola]